MISRHESGPGFGQSPAPIELFRGENYFLSSMYPLPMGVRTPDGKAVGSVEIGYQAEKFPNPTRRLILESVDGHSAKWLANNLEKDGVEKRADWTDENKLHVMRWYVRQKFGRNEDVAEKLLDTGNAQLIEKNNWGDVFWGVSRVRGKGEQGENHLGLLLMETRDLLAQGVDLLELAKEEAAHLEFFHTILKD